MRIIAAAPSDLAEIVALDDAGVLEQFHGAIDGGDRNMRVDFRAASIELLDVRVIGCMDAVPSLQL